MASVYVLPEWRNRGLARHLLSQVVKRYELLHLWAFTSELADFYATLGFEHVETIPRHGDHENIVFMIRKTAIY